MNYDYEADLNRLKEQQKQAAIADLDKQKNQSLSDLNAEEATIKPTYYKKKDTVNVQNQIAAKNFHEYLANSGRSNSGIGAQYEMSRQNSLQRSLNDLNTQEAADLADIARRKTDVNNAYNSGLTSANAQIEANYITNLLNERQKAWEREQAEKEFNESVRQFNASLAASRSSGGGSSRSSRSSSSSKKYEVNTPYYQGDLNSDAKYGTFSTKDAYGVSYQPNNIGKDKDGNVKYLKSSGKTVAEMYGAGALVGATGANLDNQTVWKYGKNYYIWDGSQNQYIKMN